MIIYLDFVCQGEEVGGKKSILDMDPEVQAIMEMTGKTLHSQGLREPEEDQDQWWRPRHVAAHDGTDDYWPSRLISDPVSSTLLMTPEMMSVTQDLSRSQGWAGGKSGGALEPLYANMFVLLFLFSAVCVRHYSHKAGLFFFPHIKL